MKKIAYLFGITILLLSACGKDNFVYPERVLYKRLAAQGGVWECEKFEHYTITGGVETFDSTYYRERQFVFYEHSEIFDYNTQSDIAYYAVAVLNKGVGGTKYALWAEEDRIVFEDYGTSVAAPQYTFTIRENKAHEQVWEVYNFVADATFERIVITLKHCPNCEPYYPLYEISTI